MGVSRNKVKEDSFLRGSRDCDRRCKLERRPEVVRTRVGSFAKEDRQGPRSRSVTKVFGGYRSWPSRRQRTHGIKPVETLIKNS